MKKMHAFYTSAAALLLSGFLIGCGGGSDGGSGSSGDAELTSENVSGFVNMVSEQAGCTYSDNQAAAVRDSSLLIDVAVARDVIKSTYDAKMADGAMPRETETIYGTCGGSATQSSTNTVLTMTFDEYCSEDYGGTTTTLDGSLKMTASQSGTVTISTPSPLNVVTNNPNTDETVDVTVDVNNAKITIDQDGSIEATASSITMTDNINNDTYAIKDAQASVASDGTIAFSATYTDPDMGSVDVSGTANQDGTGTMTVTGANGTTATIVSTSEYGVYEVQTNGESTGSMDCSQADTSILDGLLF